MLAGVSYLSVPLTFEELFYITRLIEVRSHREAKSRRVNTLSIFRDGRRDIGSLCAGSVISIDTVLSAHRPEPNVDARFGHFDHVHSATVISKRLAVRVWIRVDDGTSGTKVGCLIAVCKAYSVIGLSALLQRWSLRPTGLIECRDSQRQCI